MELNALVANTDTSQIYSMYNSTSTLNYFVIQKNYHINEEEVVSPCQIAEEKYRYYKSPAQGWQMF